jgi:2'-5' RNA ligase superfamily protein
MHHLVIPLDADHAHAVAVLGRGAAAACGVAAAADANPHVTLLTYTGPTHEQAQASIQTVALATEPFWLHAHGYGFFTGDTPSELSLHVPVVRTAALDALHRGLRGALQRAGADIAPWSEPDLWSPHITLLDRGLDHASLGVAAGWLAHGRHPSWRIPVDRVAIVSGRRDQARPGPVVLFGVPGAMRTPE